MTPFERAEEAKRMLDSPVLRGALDDIRANLIGKLETLPIGDVDTQHEIALTLQLLKRLREQLAKYADDVTVDQQKRRHETWVERMREKLTT